MSRLSRRGALTAGAVLLAGCSEGSWLGDTPPPPLPGERKPVLLLEDQLSADPRLAELNVVLPPAVRNTSWPQSGGVPAHAMQHLEAANTLDVAWRSSIGAGAGGGSRLLAGPVVAGGRVFALDADGMTTAVDASTGNEVWQFYPDEVEEVDRLAGGAAAYDDGQLFVVTGNGMVYRLDGSRRWRGLASPHQGADPCRTDRGRRARAGVHCRRPAVRARHGHGRAAVAACGPVRADGTSGRRITRRRRRDRDRGLRFRRGGGAFARQRPAALERHGPAPAANAGDREHR